MNTTSSYFLLNVLYLSLVLRVVANEKVTLDIKSERPITSTTTPAIFATLPLGPQA